MTSLDRDAPLRASGALRLIGEAQTPLAERPIKVADRLAAYLLGARMDELPPPPRLRLVAMPAHDPGRDEAVRASPRCSRTTPGCRSSSPGRTPSRCSPRRTVARSSSCTRATSSSAT